MAKKITLETIAAMLTKHGESIAQQSEVLTTHGTEIADLTASIAHVIKHMATKDDISELRRELKSDIARVQTQVNSIEEQLRLGRYEQRLGDLETDLFGTPRR